MQPGLTALHDKFGKFTSFSLVFLILFLIVASSKGHGLHATLFAPVTIVCDLKSVLPSVLQGFNASLVIEICFV